MSPSRLLPFLVALLLGGALVLAAPATQLGPTIFDAGGVALSADGSTAFVSTTSNVNAAVYVIPVPITASSNLSPSPYWSTTDPVQIYYIAASTSASPQLVWLLDNQNAHLMSLVINTASPATNTSLVYDFGLSNQVLIDGMFFQASTHTLFFSCYDHFGGATNDFIAFLDPTSSSPSLQTLYSTSFSAAIAGLAVSSTNLYFASVTSPLADSVAELWSVPLTSPGSTALIPSSTPATLLYTTADPDLSSLTPGALVYPAAFALNAAESILYMTDIGNQDAQAAASPHAVFALWPLYSATAPLNLTGLYEYEGTNTEVQQSFALSPDQSTLYWAATGNKNGLYITSRANSSLPTLVAPSQPPPSSASSSTAGPASTLSSVASSSTRLPATSAPTPTSTPPSLTSSPADNSTLLPVGTVTVVTRFSFSDPNDGLSCLTSDATTTQAYSASDGGDIFAWSLSSPPSSVTPTYILGDGQTISFIDCQANPSGATLYLLDTRGGALYSYDTTAAATAPVVVTRFPDEVVGALTALAIDFVAIVAYVGTRSSDLIYAVNVSARGQTSSSFDAYAVGGDVSALTLSSDGTTLYYATPAPAVDVASSVNALQVQAGVIADPSTPTVLYSSVALIYPDSLLFNGSTLYLKDGGAFHGEQEPGQDPSSYQTLYALPLTPDPSAIIPLLRTDVVNLPPGLLLAPDGSRLFFASKASVDSLLLLPQLALSTQSSSSTAPPGVTSGTGASGGSSLTGGASTGGATPTGGLAPGGSQAASSGDSLSHGAIAGIVVGVVVFVVLVAGAALLCVRGRSGKGAYSERVHSPRVSVVELSNV